MWQQLVTMLQMQDSMNTKVHPRWVSQNFEWYRAVWIECAELMDHQGYKWWKKQEADTEQVELEVIDIWHFGMSALFVDNRSVEAIAEAIVSDLNAYTDSAVGVREATEALAQHSLATHGFSVPLFWDLLNAVELDFTELFRHYVGKNVLNFFRQDNGYKDGSYIKVWHGEEDNEVLANLVTTLDASADDFQQQLYSAFIYQ